MIAFVFWLIVAIVFAFISASMARSRGRSGGLWGVLGFFLGIFTVLILAIIGEDRTGHMIDHPAVTAPTSNLDELAKLKLLLDDGVLTQEEFESQKKAILG